MTTELTMEMLSEPIAILDTYASNLVAIDDLGDGNFRLTFSAKQRSTYGGTEHVIVSRLILPAGAVHAALKQTAQALTRPGVH